MLHLYVESKKTNQMNKQNKPEIDPQNIGSIYIYIYLYSNRGKK